MPTPALRELLLYLAHLTPKRALNLLLCGLGYALSLLTRTPVVLGRPYSISVEPTTRCNLHCPQCPTGAGTLGRAQADMELGLFQSIASSIAPYATTTLLHFQGEPLLHPQVIPMVEHATGRRLITELATNGTLLSPAMALGLVRAGLKKVVITIDSPRAGEFGFYRRGGSLAEVEEGIANLRAAKRALGTSYPLVVLELLALKGNLHRLGEFRAWGARMEGDVLRVKTAQFLSAIDSKRDIPLGTAYSRYRVAPDGRIALRGSARASCPAPWFKLSVTHDGGVVACCFDPKGLRPLGVVESGSIETAWRSEAFRRLRATLLARGRVGPICGECPMGRAPIDLPAALGGGG